MGKIQYTKFGTVDAQPDYNLADASVNELTQLVTEYINRADNCFYGEAETPEHAITNIAIAERYLRELKERVITTSI